MNWDTATVSLIQAAIGLVIGVGTMTYVQTSGQHSKRESKWMTFGVVAVFVVLMMLLHGDRWLVPRRLIEVVTLIWVARMFCRISWRLDNRRRLCKLGSREHSRTH